MATASEFNQIVSSVGLLFRGRDHTRRVFLGSCFCVQRADVFMTAAHCLEGTSPDDLWVNHHGGPNSDLFSQARSLKIVQSADIGIVVTDAPRAKWVQPFKFVRFYANLGERVCAFGYSNQTLQLNVSPVKETLRFIRGSVQRPFIHQSTVFPDAKYSAYELSFQCPTGLSGGPLFLEDDPTTVIGVLTEGLDAGTLVDEYETVIDKNCGKVTRVIQNQRIISYAVAANIIEVSHELESVLGNPLLVRYSG